MQRKTMRRNRAMAMAELVLVIPLILVIFVLLFYFGRLMVRIQHTSVMSQYETWRAVAGSPGPSASDPLGHPQLNETFFHSKADEITRPIHNDFFPEEPYEEMVDAADAISIDAGDLTDAYLYRPDGEHRNPRGKQRGFTVFYQNTYEEWQRLDTVNDKRDITNPETKDKAILRRASRIGNDWSYTNDWKASADDWTGRGVHGPHHLRGVRDAFYKEFDDELDAIDGFHDTEYDFGGSAENPAGDSLAGLVRQLYLQAPGYRGPKIIDR